MTLEEMNAKYHGRPMNFKAWKHPVFGTPPFLGFSAEARCADGNYYTVRGILVMTAPVPPHALRRGEGVFDRLAKVTLYDAYVSEVCDGGNRFADDIAALIAPLVGFSADEGKCLYVRNNVCPWDISDVIMRGGGRAELDAAWERVKRELVHFTACKFGLPEPTDLSEPKEDMEEVERRMKGRMPLTLSELRVRMEQTLCSESTPSWSRSQNWVDLRNEMLDEMFDRVDVTLPPQAHEFCYLLNGRKPKGWTRVLERRRELYKANGGVL